MKKWLLVPFIHSITHAFVQQTLTYVSGCYHNGACHPVKTVIKMDNCTQYVCYSKNRDLNRGVYKAGTARPKWKARATGTL